MDLTEVKALLEQRVKEAEQRLEAKLQSQLQSLRSELSRLSQSQGHSKVPEHNHAGYMTANHWSSEVKTINQALAGIWERLDKLERRVK